MHMRPENNATAYSALQIFLREPFCNLATLYLEMTVTSDEVIHFMFCQLIPVQQLWFELLNS